MKVYPSVVVGRLSGTAGKTVAASWKGINYLRGWVKPANPKTAAQTLQRTAFARCVECWQHRIAAEKLYLDKLGSDVRLSGFNVYQSDSTKTERDDHGHRTMPANRYLDPVEGFAAAPGAGATSIDLTWTVGTWIADDLPVVSYRKKEAVGDEYETPWVDFDPAAVTMADGALTVDGLVGGADYVVALYPHDQSEDTRGGGAFKLAAASA